MKNEIITTSNTPQQGEIILYQPNETVRLEVRLEDDTVWLTQAQMAELFQKDRTVIGRHIRNVYKEGELEQNITCAKFAHMGTEGDQHYIDDTVLIMLDKRESGVASTIYTQHISQQLQLDIDRHNAQYTPITVKHFNRAHDRFLLVDDEVYHIGASLKDLGKKWFAFTLMHDLTSEELIQKIQLTI